MKKIYDSGSLCDICLFKEKKCDAKIQTLHCALRWRTSMLISYVCKFFYYMTFRLWVLNHSHIWWRRKQMKSCRSYFHGTLPLRLVEMIQNWIILRLTQLGFIVQHSYNIGIWMVTILRVLYIQNDLSMILLSSVLGTHTHLFI